MPWEKCCWIPAYFKFWIVKCYEGSPNGVAKARPIHGLSNDSSQSACYRDGIGNWTCENTFVLLFDVKNLAKRQIDELWQKYHKDSINVRMWVLKNLESIFFYVQHAPMDLNAQTQDDIPFTLGIQIPW